VSRIFCPVKKINLSSKIYMSQAIEGIRHFWKCLVISGNASAIAGIPVLPRQLWEFQAFGGI
jgi:hypothetical protein